jgi:head-tail adaptor
MKAGQMRHRLQIERPVLATDAFQGVTKTWAVITEVDAAIDSVSGRVWGREFMGADRELAEAEWLITIRETPGTVIEPSWRGVDVDDAAGRTFDFIAILPSHDRAVLTIAASSGRSQP